MLTAKNIATVIVFTLIGMACGAQAATSNMKANIVFIVIGGLFFMTTGICGIIISRKEV